MRRGCVHAPRLFAVTAAILIVAIAGISRATETPADSSQVPADSLIGVAVPCQDVQTGFAFSLRAQRVLHSGSVDAGWIPVGTPCVGSGTGLFSSVAPDGEGGSYVSWVDSKHADADIYLQRFGTDGMRRDGWPEGGVAVCSAGRSQYQVSITEDGEGGVYLAWTDFRAGLAGDIYATRVDGSGEVHEGWTAFGTPVSVNQAEQSVPQVLGRGSEGVLLVWVDRRSGVTELYGQQLTGQGQLTSGWSADGSPLSQSGNHALEPRVVADSTGNGVLFWRRETSVSSLYAVSLLGLGAGGTGLAVPIELVSGAQDLGAIGIARSGAHGVLTAWSERKGGNWSVRVQRVDLSSSASLAWTAAGVLLHEGTVGNNAPAVLSDGNSGAVVAWEDYRTADQGDIYVSRVDSSGNKAEGWPESGLAVASGTRGQFEPRLKRSSDSASIATWLDEEEGGSGMFLRSRRAMAAAPKLMSSVARPGHVSLVWKVGAVTGVEFRILRRLGSEEWMDLAEASPNDSSQIVYHDRSVAEGSEVGYRVLSRSEDVEAYSEPVVIQVPVTPVRLALRSAWARPELNLILVSVALPRGPSPTLDLIDVAGRRAVRERLETLEPGDHTLTMRVPSRLASGVYFLRVVQGKEALSTKVIYVR